MTEADELQQVANEMRHACLAMCVRQLNRRITRIYDAALRPYGIGTAQFNILTALAIAGAGGVRQSKVAEVLDLEKSTLSRNLDRMLEAGWVSSERDDQGGVRLRLTAQGRRIMKKALQGWRAAQQQASTEAHAPLVEALTRAARASDPTRSAFGL